MLKNTKNKKSSWYKDFFKKYYLETYKDRLRFEKTRKEVGFIIDILRLPKGSKILDLCGGDGRHSIPLAKKGYSITLLDLNKKFLKMAKKRARQEKIKISTIQADMRQIPFFNEFDAIINIFTSFGYLENKKEDQKVLNQVCKTLKPGGKFILDTKNINFPGMCASYKQWYKAGNFLILEKSSFNHQTKRQLVERIIINEKNHKKTFVYYSLRLYSLVELKKMLEQSKLKLIGKFGNFNKDRFFSNKSKRLILIAQK